MRQTDIFEPLYPPCPVCEGNGERLLSVTVKGSSTNSDWLLMRFQAQALGTWEKIAPAMRELIEAKCAAARWQAGPQEFVRCDLCVGSGVLVHERVAERAALEKKARAFFARPVSNPLEY